MVNIMVEHETTEKTVEVDRQGRMVLPSRLRERLGLKKGGRVSIRLENSSRVILEPRTSEKIEERVENWVNVALSTKAQIFSDERKTRQHRAMMGAKWMSSEYARRKLGLTR